MAYKSDNKGRGRSSRNSKGSGSDSGPRAWNQRTSHEENDGDKPAEPKKSAHTRPSRDGDSPPSRKDEKPFRRDDEKTFRKKTGDIREGDPSITNDEKGPSEKRPRKQPETNDRPERKAYSSKRTEDPRYGSPRDGGSFKRKPYAGRDDKEPKTYPDRKEDGFTERKKYPRKDDNRPFRSRKDDGPYERKEYTRKEDSKPYRTHKEEDASNKTSYTPRDDRRPFKSKEDDGSKERKDYIRKDDRPSRERPYKSDRPDRDRKPFSRDTMRKPFRKSTAVGRETSRDRDKKVFTYPDGSVREEKLTRLNKYLANSGICSRREADELIKAGLVTVNGEIVTEMGVKVSRTDIVKYNNTAIRKERKVYVLLNKPKDYITTTEDPEERKTVMNLVENACKERIYPVGRLDRNTTGLLLITNDGELTKKLTHPSSNIKKIYHAELDKNLTSADLKKIAAGLELEDGMVKVDEINYDGDGLDKTQVGIALHSGKNRIVRRIFESLGYEVRKLDRVIFAGLTKKDLPRGRWRNLSELEVNMLKMIAGSH